MFRYQSGVTQDEIRSEIQRYDYYKDATTEEIDEAIATQVESEDSEVLYFARYEYIKKRINKQFMNLDQGLLDRFMDEKLYDLIFGEQES